MKRFLAILALAAGAASAENALLESDVSAICGARTDRPAPPIGFGPGVATPAGDVSGPGTDEIGEFLQEMVAPGEWDGEGITIESSGEKMLVHQTAENREKIEALLSMLEARCNRAVRVRVSVIALAPGVAASLKLAAGPLPAATATALDAAVADAARGALVCELSVATRAGNRAHEAALKRRTLDKGREAQVAAGSTGHATIPGFLDEGATLDVLPWIAPDGSVVATVQLAVARVRSVDTFDLPAAAGGPVSLPLEDIFEVRTTATLPAAASVVLALGPAGADRPGWTLAAVARARVDAVPAPAAAEGKSIRAYDVGALLHVPMTFAGPVLGAPDPMNNAVPVTEEAPSEGETRLGGAIIERLQRDVLAEVWNNSEATAVVLRDQLVVLGPAKLHEAIGPWLEGLAPANGVPVITEAWAFAVPVAEWNARRDVLRRPGGLTEELFREFTEGIDAGRGRLVAATAACSRTGATGYVASGSRRRVVLRWSGSVAPGVAAGDPVLANADDGLALAFASRPAGKDGIAPGLRGQWSKLGEPKRVESAGTFGPVQSVEAETAAFDAPGPLADGKPTLTGTAVVGEEGKEEVMLFFVRARKP